MTMFEWGYEDVYNFHNNYKDEGFKNEFDAERVYGILCSKLQAVKQIVYCSRKTFKSYGIKTNWVEVRINETGSYPVTVRAIYGWCDNAMEEFQIICDELKCFPLLCKKENRHLTLDFTDTELKEIYVPVAWGFDLDYVTRTLFNRFEDDMELPYSLFDSDKWKMGESSDYRRIYTNVAQIQIHHDNDLKILSNSHGIVITACAAMDSTHLFNINPPEQIEYIYPLVQATFAITCEKAALVSYKIIRC